MSKINAFSRVLNQKVKSIDFQLMDNLNMTAWIQHWGPRQ